ncbi:MAG: HAD family hydrolase [Acidobacteria bacterium]|nr:MAG: HAD family hydrolase [Acidobacteriota bacterium]
MRGAIFDLDGTIVDNMPVHVEAFAVFVERHRLPPLTLEDRRRLDGKRNRDIFPDLFSRPLSEEELRVYAEEKEQLYRTFSAGRLSPVPGFERLLAALEQREVAVAVATSAPPENVVHTLRELRLTDRLPVVVRSDEVPRGKPWPDVFLAAARRLGIPAAECVAFEDAPAGVAAAAAAGMRTVALTTSFGAVDFEAQEVRPDHLVRDFEEFLEGPGRQLLPGTPAPR